MGLWNALTEEFSDMASVAMVVRVLSRLLVAAALGALLGHERESRGKSAGMRTHMLVSLGAALFMLAPQLAGFAESEMSRVVQGIVAGIGFLGAGAIVKADSEEHVQGMTTAAGIWLTAAIGMTVGLGRLATAIVSGVLAFGILHLHHHMTRPKEN